MKKKYDLLTLHEFSQKKLNSILDLALKMKKNPKKYGSSLAGRTLAMIFHKPSTRTRVSFEVGMFQLGGHALFLNANDIQLSKAGSVSDFAVLQKKGETNADTARVLSRFVDLIMIRTFAHSIVEEFSEGATIPVINGLTDAHHPCQALADLLTLKEHFGKLKGLRLVYVGDGNNVVHSLLIGCAIAGMHMRVVCPRNYTPNRRIFAEAFRLARKNKVDLQITHELKGAVRDADAVYTDVWTSMGQEREIQARVKAFSGYRVTKKLMDESDHAVFLHCLPANRGEEVDSEVLDGKRSLVWDQAENRLHVQKAIMHDLLN